MDARILRSSVLFASLTLAAAVALSALPSIAQQQEDSSGQSTGDAVADAARKAREQKKKDTPKPKKVYTDEDVNHSVSPTPPVSSDASATTEEGAPKNNPDAQAAKDKDASGKPSQPEESAESKWRKQFKEAYASLDKAEKELNILQREDNKAQVQYYSDPQKALAEQYTRKDINEHDAKIAAKQKEIQQIKQRIGDMEDALRKSGGDPGWAAE
jgi:uncharacterized protein YoaH (UPF0181 family)